MRIVRRYEARFQSSSEWELHHRDRQLQAIYYRGLQCNKTGKKKCAFELGRGYDNNMDIVIYIPLRVSPGICRDRQSLVRQMTFWIEIRIYSRQVKDAMLSVTANGENHTPNPRSPDSSERKGCRSSPEQRACRALILSLRSVDQYRGRLSQPLPVDRLHRQ